MSRVAKHGNRNAGQTGRALYRLLPLQVVGFSLAGLGYWWAYQHSRYYTGAEPATLSCISCHVRATGGGFLDRASPPRYHTPLNLAAAPDGHFLYVTAQSSNSLLVIDLRQGRLVRAIPVGERPHSVALTPDGATAYVSNERADSVSVVDLRAGKAVRTIPAGHLPAGLALGPDEQTLFVANWGFDSISVIDLQRGEEGVRLAAGGGPKYMALSPDGSLLVVGNELSSVGRAREIPVSEVTLIHPGSRRVVARKRMVNAHLLQGVAVTPQGDLALAALVRPKNLLPIIQVSQGWVMNNGLGIVRLATGEVFQLLLDEREAYYADPYGLAVTPDGRYAFVGHSSVDVVSVLDLNRVREVLAEAVTPELVNQYAHHQDLSGRFVVKRIPTGANPRGMALSPDGRLLYVAERLDDSILVIDASSWEAVSRIPLGSSSRESAVRRGEKLFNSASATFQNQFSCRSCHPNDHVDRLQYDLEPDGLGRNIVDNRTLLGIRGTAPFKWNGNNTSLFMQCGIRFARILTRLEPFPPDDLSALVAFMRSLSQPSNPYRSPDGKLTPSQERGRRFFERSATMEGRPIPAEMRCITCHPPPLFTDRQRADVGTVSETGDTREFDTPHLVNIFNSAPYLHDGRARTLEEIWTLFNDDDEHGVTSDMTGEDLNDLIEYLRTL